MAVLDHAPSTGPGLWLGRWLWRDYFRHYLWWIVAAAILMGVEGSMLGVISYIVRPMFDQVFVGGSRVAVYWIAGVILGVFLARAFAGFGQRVIMAAIAQWVTTRMQGDLVRHMMRLDSAFFRDNAPGALIERVRGDTLAIQAAFTSVFTALGRDIISLLALLAVALSIDWIWTLVAVLGVPVLIGPVAILQRQIQAATRRARAAAAVISTRLDEIFHGINPIKLNTLEAHQDARFLDVVRRYVRVQIRAEAGQAGVPALMDIIAGIGFFGVLLYGGMQIVGGTKTLGEFMSFFTAMGLVFEPLRRIGNVSARWQAARASFERLHAIFETQPTILEPAHPVPATPQAGRGDIVFENVEFAYGEQPVLRGLSLSAEAGRMTALVGPSGAGKSTVFHLLTRLVDPDAGRVTIGGIPVDALRLGDLRRQFSVVAQDAALFDETIAQNILLGRLDATGADLRRATDAAFVNEFSATLPQGLDSAAGPRGANLSGGQRQRVAIARAVLRDAPVLLLDEPTSALDARSEAAVQEALERLSEGRTTLVIAHRLATILHADKIVVMDKGRVVDEGTHGELLARGGIYAGLYRLQFEG